MAAHRKVPMMPDTADGPLIVVPVVEASVNVDQELICVTRDKAVLCFYRYLHRVEGRRAWIAPAGILVTIVLVLATAAFKPVRRGISGAPWQAVFVLLALATFAWLVAAVARVRRAIDPEDLADELGGRRPVGERVAATPETTGPGG